MSRVFFLLLPMLKNVNSQIGQGSQNEIMKTPYPARKRTWLYFKGFKPLSFPLNFDAIQSKVSSMGKKKRSETTESFANWLIDCIQKG